MTLAVAGVLVSGLLAGCHSGTGADGPTRADAAARPAPAVTTPAPSTPAPAAAPAAAAPAAAAPYCGASRYVEEIVVEQWADGRLRISVRPTSAARHAERHEATDAIWTAIGGCVTTLPALGRDVTDSLHAQLACHQDLALIPALGGGRGYATGDTYDLESWRPMMRPNSMSTWISTRCGNTLGTDPTGPPARVFRPDGVAPRHTVAGEHA
ncbi:Protein of unknown function (DUF2599) [Frankia torreyi]|uniref:DUF2599 domain-containing protein n=1 Tax=Frankia torreyi TaxID=1856 RepID=A0A0D8BPF4_9ACTN|nr:MULTISPECIES: DUF2599 domain-containing protein [Frankia]KJE25257.1 Protein of unknown function (DUF2599) [Frankia torreyi]KQM07927.1 Protein of unknown function (DUF2599) [Frankia sp. CpI1-P]